MKMFKAITAFLISLALSFTLGAVISHIAQDHYQILISELTVGTILFAASILVELGMPRYRGMAFAIQQEFWVNYIVGNLFKNNQFLNYCDDDDRHVLNGSVVHVPTAGAVPAVVKNRSSYPATVTRRTDVDITYALDVYTTDPIHIPRAEELEVSYDKMGSVLDEHVSALEQVIGDDFLIKWATNAGTILRTTGAASAEALAPSATGTRLALIKDDLRKAAATMDRNNIPSGDRYALIPSDMYQQLLTDATLLARDGIFGGEVDIKNGIVGTLYGFKLMKRSSVTVYDATPALKALGAAGAATDNMGAICWQKSSITKALGDKEFFEDTKNPLYYGDIYSALIKMGGRTKRTAGVVMIVQA